MSPLVSVVIPTHNRERTLGRAVRSVLNQTLEDLELIVVDDASSDNSREVVTLFNDPRIQYIRIEKKGGACAARNIGIEAARGRLIAFQDSDDEWLSEKLARQVALLNERGDDFGACYTSYIRHHGANVNLFPSPDVRIPDGEVFEDLLRQSFIGTQTLMVRTHVLQQVGGFDETLPRLQDWDISLRLSQITKIAHVAEPMVLVHHSEKSITSSGIASNYAARHRIFEKMSAGMTSNSKILAAHSYYIGRLATALHHRAPARKFAWHAVQLDPWRPKYWASLALAWFAA